MSLPLTVTLSITYSPAAPVSDLAPTQASPPPVPFPVFPVVLHLSRTSWPQAPIRRYPTPLPQFTSFSRLRRPCPGPSRCVPTPPQDLHQTVVLHTHTPSPSPPPSPPYFTPSSVHPQSRASLGMPGVPLWIPSSPSHRPTRVERRAALTRIPPGRWRSEGAPARLRTRTAAEWAHGGNGKDRVVAPLRPPGHRPRPAPAATWHSRAGRRWAREPGKTGPRRPRPPGSRAAF